MALLHKGKIIKTVSFFGFGKSNRAVFNYLRKHYPDLSFTVRLTKKECNLPTCACIFEGEDAFRDFYEDAVFVSPSVRRDKPIFRGALLSSDAELFFEKNTEKVFAVTGSDGKSTTSFLAAELLKSENGNSYAIGNIGVPFTEALDYPKPCAFSAELSSFQLMDFAPKTERAIITNISPNHLDWHLSMEEYIGAKENVLKNTREPVFFLDGINQALLKKYPPKALASLLLSEKEIRKYAADIYVYVKDGDIYANGEKLLSLSDVTRREEYNLKNFLSAIALCYGSFDKRELKRIAKSFSGLPHRFELVRELDGTKIFNSSIDSSPQRTLATLSAQKKPYVLLMGGRTKMKNYEILRDLIEKNAHALVLTGENRLEIYDKITPVSTPVFVEENFQSAVERAFGLAKGKCNFIFSPASVSFDAFENFEQRGEAFSAAVKLLK